MSKQKNNANGDKHARNKQRAMIRESEDKKWNNTNPNSWIDNKEDELDDDDSLFFEQNDEDGEFDDDEFADESQFRDGFQITDRP